MERRGGAPEAEVAVLGELKAGLDTIPVLLITTGVVVDEEPQHVPNMGSHDPGLQ